MSWLRIPAAVLLLALVLRAEPPGTLVDLQPVTATPVRDWNQLFLERVTKDLPDRGEGFQELAPFSLFQHLARTCLLERVPSMGLTYTSLDSHQHPRLYSGRIFLPSRTGSAPSRVSLVVYQHGTETRKRDTPYFNRGAETMLGALGAEIGGFAVAMPDGDGMGADPSPERHAYCHEATTARCLLDLVRAIEGSGDRIFDGINYVWDGRLFIMGYSEGGYIALAAVKALSTDPAWADLRLDGAACMGGPFDLPRMVRTLLGGTESTYSRPYIPAYLLATWPELYPGTFQFDQAVNPRLLETRPSRPGNPDQGSAFQWLDGTLGGDQITARIQARLTGDAHQPVIARNVLNEIWAEAEVDRPDSRVNRLLEANGLVGGWQPKVPVLLAHDPWDECVGFYNSVNLVEDWRRMGCRPLDIIPLAAAGHGAGHVGGAILSVPMAFTWFKAGMPDSMMGMAAATLQALAGSAAAPDILAVLARAATLATREQNLNRPEFPVSLIRQSPGGSWSVALADRAGTAGKVKLYTLAPFPQFPGQAAVPGRRGYPRFLQQLKFRGDRCSLPPDQDCFLAVYPEHGLVALTLTFQAPGRLGQLSIRQIKNKLFGSSAPALIPDPAFLKPRIQPASFEHPDHPTPFISLP
jgi:hypothetical protein